MARAKIVKTPVFFIATQFRKEPVKINFYTKEGESVDEKDVRKEKTDEGVLLYTYRHGYRPVVVHQ